MLSRKVCLIFQVKGCQGTRHAANHRALSGVFGEKTEGMEAAWYVLPSCSFWGHGSALDWWSVCKGSLPEGDGLRVGEKRCLTVVGKHKENRGLAVKKRQVAKSGLAVPALVHQAHDGQSASGHATGLEIWQESPTLV